jgi:hypothetical protein
MEDMKIEKSIRNSVVGIGTAKLNDNDGSSEKFNNFTLQKALDKFKERNGVAADIHIRMLSATHNPTDEESKILLLSPNEDDNSGVFVAPVKGTQ